jgi:hypothetical protein
VVKTEEEREENAVCGGRGENGVRKNTTTKERTAPPPKKEQQHHHRKNTTSTINAFMQPQPHPPSTATTLHIPKGIHGKYIF